MNVTLHIDGKPVMLEKVARKSGEVSFTLEGKNYHFRSAKLPDGRNLLERETAPGVWQRVSGMAWQIKDAKRVALGKSEAKIAEQSKKSAAGAEGALSPTAPMPGLIRQLLVKPGDAVEKGQPLLVMEAMKLQTTLSAGGVGKVEAVLVKVGDLVTDGAELIKISPLKS